MDKPILKPEILDRIANLLHEDPHALKGCCLVSKSWVPRTRKHIFKCVDFKYSGDFDRWKRKFPNPVKSPAIHTRSLFFRQKDQLTYSDIPWIHSFTNVVQLEVDCGDHHQGRPFSLFHCLSPTVKSLSMDWTDLPSRQIFDFNLFLPLTDGPACHRLRNG